MKTTEIDSAVRAIKMHAEIRTSKEVNTTVAVVVVMIMMVIMINIMTSRAQWLRGRAPDSRLRELGFES